MDRHVNLEGRTAVITGAASGLGRATAELLAKHGASVALFDADAGGVEEVAGSLGTAALPVRVDVTDPEAIERGVGRTLEAFDAIHVCVNAAGVVTPGIITDGRTPLPLERFRRVIDINLVGLFDVMRHCVTAMCANDPVDGERGVVVNVSSGAADQGQRGQAAYAASKAAIIGMTLPTARDLAPYGVRVVSIAPGLFDTAMVGGLPLPLREDLAQRVLHPKRLGDPTEFAVLVRHIVENPYLNATTVNLDAGIRMT